LKAWRVRVGVFALTLGLVVICAGWVLTRQHSESVTVAPPEDKTTISERTTPPNTKPAASLPAEDVPGRDVPGLPRYPGSVRVEYERKEQDLLVFTRVRYLSRARVDVIRGFYRGVFRAEGWKVANVEFSEDEWTFLVIDGERETDVEIGPYGPGVTKVDIGSSELRPTKEVTPEEKPRREASPATPAPESTPAPQPTATPTPAPDDDYYEGGGEDRDDLGDDGGGDD
jgi:hypothetical protein